MNTPPMTSAPTRAPSALRDLARRPWRARVIAVIIAAILAAAIAWYVGMDEWHAGGVGAVVIALGILWLAVPERDPLVWPAEDAGANDGNRREVTRLSWSLRTRKGRVRPDAVRRIRTLAASRLAAHRVDLDDAHDRPTVEALIGSHAYNTLRQNPVRPPRIRDVERCLDALDTLNPPNTATGKRVS